MMEVIRSTETSVLTRTTQRHIPEDGILYSHRHENLKSYEVLFYLSVLSQGNLLEDKRFVTYGLLLVVLVVLKFNKPDI
jgi:hypothetical protein